MTILHDLASTSIADAEDVAGVLSSAGMAVALLEARDDLNAVVRGIGERSPHLVFNLVETFAGDRRYRPDIAAALDLVSVPYTGAGPSGLHLAAAPELAHRLLVSYGIAAPPTGLGGTARLAVVGNDRLVVLPANDDAMAAIAAGFAALRLRDYALLEMVARPEAAIVRAIPNPPLGRRGALSRVAADAGLAYEELVLAIADEAWERHKEVAAAVKTA